VQHSQNDATTDDQPDDAADTLGFFRFHSDERFSRQTADLRVNYSFSDQSAVTVGGVFERQSNRGSSTSPFGDTPENTEERANRAVYAQWLGEWSRLSVQLGARAEDNDQFGSFGTYRGGVAYRVSPMLRFRASAGTAFKQPRFFEQFAQGFVTGNPDLEPEESRSLEAGADLIVGRATFTASYFDQKFKNLIQYIGLPALPTDPNYVNVAGAHVSGLEVGATLSLGTVQLNGNYTLLDTEVTNEGDGEDPSFLEGEQLLRRPRHSGSLTASLLFERGLAGATAHYAGERSDLDFASFPASRVTLPAHTRVDVNGEYRLTSSVAGTLKIENLLGEEYEEVLGFPAPQRVIYLGARLSLQ
jgi:vitamin B12 transporter